eukprot:292083-Chlamydomonas_euryale.AAC.1
MEHHTPHALRLHAPYAAGRICRCGNACGDAFTCIGPCLFCATPTVPVCRNPNRERTAPHQGHVRCKSVPPSAVISS